MDQYSRTPVGRGPVYAPYSRDPASIERALLSIGVKVLRFKRIRSINQKGANSHTHYSYYLQSHT